jgi:hypothetical protein
MRHPFLLKAQAVVAQKYLRQWCASDFAWWRKPNVL